MMELLKARKALWLLVRLAGALLLSACQLVSEKSTDLRLANMQPPELNLQPADLPKVTAEQVQERYYQYLEIAKDPEIRVRVLHRLAGLELLATKERTEQEEERYYKAAAIAYEELLARYPEREDNDFALYQLARAYDLLADTDNSLGSLTRLVEGFPNSDYYLEAQFRRGEIHFSYQDYPQAEAAYTEVVAAGDISAFYSISLYMQGWSQFKQENYSNALVSFIDTLDYNFPSLLTIAEANRSQNEFLDDLLRSMSVIAVRMQGTETLRQLFAEQGPRHYEYALYARLAEYQLSNERYQDGAAAYLAFADLYPQSALAPEYFVKHIEAYQDGGFPREVLKAKQTFADRYGISSTYWSANDAYLQARVKPYLQIYLPELARHFHALAQNSPELNKNSPELNKNSPRQNYYNLAGRWYREYIDTFPQDVQAPSMNMALADVLFESKQYPSAIKEYENTAYGYGPNVDPSAAAQAGYAALLTYDKWLSADQFQAQKLNRATWQADKIDSALTFAERFPSDPRTLAVLTQTAQEQLQLAQYPEALTTAQRVTQSDANAGVALLITAWLVQGQSQMALEAYSQAQNAYREVLSQLANNDPRRPDIRQRLAAALYKEGEQLLAQQSGAEAVAVFLSIAEQVPESELAASGEYDAATYLLQTQQWGPAIGILSAFRQQRPTHPLTAELSAKLLLAYESTEQWHNAAVELKALAQDTSSDEETRRKAQYQMASYYEKAGDLGLAVAGFRTYAHRYANPFELALESRYKLTELYSQLQAPEKRRYWLNSIIKLHDGAASQANERSQYLAAEAAFTLAEEHQAQYAGLPLSWPLQTSIGKKKAAFEQALNAYNKAASYQVEDFTTAATFSIADLYDSFSRSLIDSERPEGLSELELEQYELLLEDEAYPLEEVAIEVHEKNTERVGQGIYDAWVKKSFLSLRRLLPSRYDKQEQLLPYVADIQ